MDSLYLIYKKYITKNIDFFNRGKRKRTHGDKKFPTGEISFISTFL